MSTKTRRITNISFCVILMAAFIVTFSWFYVDGSELRFLQNLPDNCVATVSIWSWDETTEDRSVTLTQGQLTQILELFQSSSYWRDPSSVIYHDEKTTYDIFITYKSNSTAQCLSITSSGGYAINISGSQELPFDNDFLRIRDKEWVAKLDAILASS